MCHSVGARIMEINKDELPIINLDTPLENVGGTTMPEPIEVSSSESMPRGRPSLYTPELAHEICDRMAKGEALRAICRDENMPAHNTVIGWAMDNYQGFYDQYARAREIQAEVMFDEVLEIADDGSNDFMTITKGNQSYNIEDKEVTNRSRLRVDSRKWYLSKVLPKKFGEKIDVTSDGKAIKGNNIIFNDFKAED